MKATIDSVFAECALVVQVVVVVLMLVGVMGPGWGKPVNTTKTNMESLSLWKTCNKAPFDTYVTCQGLSDTPGWFTAVQGLVMTCFFGMWLSLGLMSAFTCRCCSRLQEDRRLLLVYCILTTIFSCIGLAGVVLFGARINDLKLALEGAQDVTWKAASSFVATTVGICFSLVCVVLVIVEIIIGPRCTVPPTDIIPVMAEAADMARSSVPMDTVA